MLLRAIAKEREITRLLGILELDLDEKNLLPPRKYQSLALSYEKAS